MKTLSSFEHVKRGCISALVAVSLACFSNSGVAASDIFLIIDEVPGESRDQTYRESIDVLAWSWATSSSYSNQSGRFEVSCPKVELLSLTKFVDKASPKLLLGQIRNTFYPTATLRVRTAGANPVENIVLEFSDVFVASISTGGSGGEDRFTENVQLGFRTVTFTYTPESGNKEIASFDVSTCEGG